MDCYFYFTQDASIDEYNIQLKEMGIRAIRYFNFMEHSEIDLWIVRGSIFIDDATILGRNIKTISDSLHDLFQRGVYIHIGHNGQIITLKGFSDFNYIVLKFIAQSITKSHTDQIKTGQKKAVLDGSKLGRKVIAPADKIKELKLQGMSLKEIQNCTGFALSTVWRHSKMNKELSL